MVTFRDELFLEEFLSLVESVEISMAHIDDAVERILRVKFVFGIFEYPLTDRSLLDLVGRKEKYNHYKGQYVESGGDDPVLKIPCNGAELVRLVAEKVPTLVILVTGRPLVLESSMLEKIESLVVAWLPGTEGRGIIDVIFGDYAFHGRLPMTWFRSVDQLPIHTAKWHDTF